MAKTVSGIQLRDGCRDVQQAINNVCACVNAGERVFELKWLNQKRAELLALAARPVRKNARTFWAKHATTMLLNAEDMLARYRDELPPTATPPPSNGSLYGDPTRSDS